MKILPEDLTLREIISAWRIFPKFLLDTIKEEIYWRFVMYPYEISSPVDWQSCRKKGLAESQRRMNRNHSAQGRNSGGSKA